MSISTMPDSKTRPTRWSSATAAALAAVSFGQRYEDLWFGSGCGETGHPGQSNQHFQNIWLLFVNPIRYRNWEEFSRNHRAKWFLLVLTVERCRVAMIDAGELFVLLANLGLVGGQVPRRTSSQWCSANKVNFKVAFFTKPSCFLIPMFFFNFQQVTLGISICQAYVQALWTLAASRGLAVNSKGNKMRSAAVARLRYDLFRFGV